MALPCPGPSKISLLDIQNTFGGYYPTAINEYYRDAGILSPTDQGTIGVPYTGSPISFADFFCKYPIFTINLFPNTVYNGQYDICYQFINTFGNDAWTGPALKTLNIPSTTILSANTTSSALYLYDRVSGLTGPQLGGGLIINNAGSIYGLGGNQYSFASNNNGGTAFEIYSAKIQIKLNNTGKIVGGGGGGGRGGYGPSWNDSPAYGVFGGRFYAQSNGGVGGFGRGGWRLDSTNTSGAPPFISANIQPILVNETTPSPPPNYTCYIDANTTLTISHFWASGIVATYYLAAKNPNQSWPLNTEGSGGFNNVTDTINLYLSSNCNDVNITFKLGTSIGYVNIFAAPNSGKVTISTTSTKVIISGSRSSTSGAITLTGGGASGSINNLTINESNPSYNISNFSASGYIGNWNIPSALTTAGYGGAGGDYGKSGSPGTNGTKTNGLGGGSPGYSIYSNVPLPFTADSTLGTLIGPKG